MKIGIVTTWFERGAAYVSRQFAQILSAQHDIFIYARGGNYAKNDVKWNLPNVTWGKVIYSPIVPTVISKKDFKKWIRRNNIELIIFNEQHWFQPILWCKKWEIKTIAYIDYYTEFTIPAFKAYDALICNTKKHYQAFKDHSSAFYVPWGTDNNLFKPQTTDLVNKNVVTFFHSAGFDGHRKGTDLFLRALGLIIDDDFKVVIHTQRDLYSQFPHLGEIIDKLLGCQKLKLINQTVTAPGLYYKGDVYVYPSRLDGIGLTIAEAISSGLACIVPDNGPMNEFVSEEFGSKIKIDRFFSRADGYYWPQCEASVKDLVKLLKLYIDNKEEVPSQKIRAREYAEQFLCQEKNFKILLDIVEDVEFKPLNSYMQQKIMEVDNHGVKKLNTYLVKTGLYRLLKNRLKY